MGGTGPSVIGFPFGEGGALDQRAFASKDCLDPGLVMQRSRILGRSAREGWAVTAAAAPILGQRTVGSETSVVGEEPEERLGPVPWGR